METYSFAFQVMPTIFSSSFVSLKKQAETPFQLICRERKILLRLKKQAEKYGL